MTVNSNFATALSDTLAHEGGWSDNPNDPGGATFKGVTKKAWEAYVGHKVTKRELRNLSISQISEFYYRKYWLKAGCHGLPSGIDVLIFDIAVNSGSSRAGIMLQDSINRLSSVKLTKDGIVGPKTRTMAARIDVFDLIDAIAFRRLTFYSQLRTFKFFKNGWRKRAISTAVFAAQVALGFRASIIKGG